MDFIVYVINGFNCFSKPFKDEKKARDWYALMLARYPNAEVELIPPKEARKI